MHHTRMVDSYARRGLPVESVGARSGTGHFYGHRPPTTIVAQIHSSRSARTDQADDAIRTDGGRLSIGDQTKGLHRRRAATALGCRTIRHLGCPSSSTDAPSRFHRDYPHSSLGFVESTMYKGDVIRRLTNLDPARFAGWLTRLRNG